MAKVHLLVIAAMAVLVFQPNRIRGQEINNDWHGISDYGSMVGSAPRHRAVINNSIPAPYQTKVMPFDQSPQSIDHGRLVYRAHCEGCHGHRGNGDGTLAQELTSVPPKVAWLSRSNMGRNDGFMYWAIAEGGIPFNTSMPEFKSVLRESEIWSVITFLRAGLPVGANDDTR